MTINPTQPGSASDRRATARLRILFLFGLGAVVTAGVLAGLLVQLRNDDIQAGKKLLTAVVQLTDEQTSRTLKSVERGVRTVEAILAEAALADSFPGLAGDLARSPATIDAQLQRLVAEHPYLNTIRVLDRNGRSLYGSDIGHAGLELSDRAYFTERRDNPGAGFRFDLPIRNRVANKWIIPATLTVRTAHGAFDGVIVAAVDPLYFHRVWALNEEIPGLSITLFRTDGVMLMRSPVNELLIGKSYASSYVFQKLHEGTDAGTFENQSTVDGQMRLFAFRQLTVYPGLVIVAGQAVDQVLSAWRRIVWIVATGWIMAVLLVGALTLWLVREWDGRRATQDRYRVLFNANPYPMVVMDPTTRGFLDVNEAAIAEYGWSRPEALAMTANDLYSPEDLETVRAIRLADRSGAARLVQGLKHRRKNGTLFDVEMHTCAIELDGRSAILSTVENVTPRHLAEAQLRQSQKMEAVGQLTGGIAHDFNNILMVILANADALQEEENLDAATMTERLEQIAQAVARASELTGQLVAFSRKQTLNPKRTDLNDLVSSTGKLLYRALGGNMEIDSLLAGDLWTVNVDRAQLETALVNLCINARDAMPNGGKLSIETRNISLNKDNVTQATDVAAGDYAMLSVTDTGSGMTEETRARVFEPFFTTKGVGKGTGLGLSMVYGFIKQSKGHITIHSEVGRGTTFRLYLPRVDGVGEVAAGRQAPPMPGGSERILVVEDELQVRTSVVKQLQSLGYAVTQAPDGAAGLAAFEAAAQPYALLLTDLVMPGQLNGRALAAKVVDRWPATRIVFMSGYAENTLSGDGTSAGGILLSKPFRKRDLAVIVRQALDGNTDPDDVLPKAA